MQLDNRFIRGTMSVTLEVQSVTRNEQIFEVCNDLVFLQELGIETP